MSIKTETVTINDRQYARTWSDAGMMIEREGNLYEEAIDPVGSGRTYTETVIAITVPDDLMGGEV